MMQPIVLLSQLLTADAQTVRRLDAALASSSDLGPNSQLDLTGKEGRGDAAERQLNRRKLSINTDDVVPGDFPFMAAMINDPEPNQEPRAFCTASLISSKYAITAAHCVLHEEFEQDSTKIYFGLQNVARIDEGKAVGYNVTGEIWIHAAKIFESTEQVEFEKWPRGNGIITHNMPVDGEEGDPLMNDVAIIELREEVPSTVVTPVQLSNTWLKHVQSDVTVAGWGLANDPLNPDSKVVQPTHAHVFKLKTKSAEHPWTGKTFNDLVIYPTGTNAEGRPESGCKGDSGAPILVEIVENGEKKWELVGVLVAGNAGAGGGCKKAIKDHSANKKLYAYGVDLKLYMDWVNEVKAGKPSYNKTRDCKEVGLAKDADTNCKDYYGVICKRRFVAPTVARQIRGQSPDAISNGTCVIDECRAVTDRHTMCKDAVGICKRKFAVEVDATLTCVTDECKDVDVADEDTNCKDSTGLICKRRFVSGASSKDSGACFTDCDATFATLTSNQTCRCGGEECSEGHNACDANGGKCSTTCPRGPNQSDSDCKCTAKPSAWSEGIDYFCTYGEECNRRAMTQEKACHRESLYSCGLQLINGTVWSWQQRDFGYCLKNEEESDIKAAAEIKRNCLNKFKREPKPECHLYRPSNCSAIGKEHDEANCKKFWSYVMNKPVEYIEETTTVQPQDGPVESTDKKVS